MPEQPSASAADSFSIHNFEELLSLDDIFVEYFNEFLRSDVFVQRITYDRELNTFVEIKQQKSSSSRLENENEIVDESTIVADNESDDDSSQASGGLATIVQLDEIPEQQGRTDGKPSLRMQKLRQVQMIEWAKNERLGLFWRTELYRQYKLCKLLVRPLTNEKEPSEYSSQGIGGYSRQSVYTAARTLSTENSNGVTAVPRPLEEADEDEEHQEQGRFLPLTNINTMFEDAMMAAEFLRMPRAFLRPGSRAYSVPVNMISSQSIFFSTVMAKNSTKMSKRSSSSKTSQQKSMSKDGEGLSSLEDGDPRRLSLFESVKIRYFEDGGGGGVEVEEENDDLGYLGLQIQSSSNQLKYKYLGSLKGMQAFVRFLETTNGGHDLYRFWLDCEFFKDTMAGLDQIENVLARTRLFRDLHDGKYHLPFMRHLQNKIRRAYADTTGTLTHDVFLQVQYDVLRRLRMYWSARFIIHQLFEQHHPQLHFPFERPQPSPVCLYPIDERAQPSLVEMTRVFVSDDYTTQSNGTSERKQPVMIKQQQQQQSDEEIEREFSTKFMRKYAMAVRRDKEAGGLFLRHVTFNERKLLPLILFCYDVDDFRYSDLDDKILEGQHGLSILNTYFGSSAKLSLDQFMPDVDIDFWLNKFYQYKFDKLSFESLYKRALLLLKDAWLRCLKDDVDRLTTAYYITPSPNESTDESGDEEEEEEEEEEGGGSDEDQTPKKHIPVKKPREESQPNLTQIPRVRSPGTQISVTNDAIYIKRPWMLRSIPSAPSERQERFIQSLEDAMTDEDRQRIRAERLERLRQTEAKRKKALKAARRRRRNQGKISNRSEATSGRTGTSRRTDGTLYIDRILPTKSQNRDNKRLILDHFQHYIKSSKTAPVKVENKLSLIFDTIKWMESINPLDKQQQLDRMKKIYFDNQSKRNIFPMSIDNTHLFNTNQGRPDPNLIQSLYNDLRFELEEEFILYCEDCLRQFEIESIEEFLSKPSSELILLFNETNQGQQNTDRDDETGIILDPDAEALTANDDGTAKATKKHYAELFQLISDAAVGRYNERFYYFYAYLTHWADAKKMPFLDRDLLFCIDVSRLKEIANDNMLQGKLRYILETYLECNLPPGPVQLDLGNLDLQQRLQRSLQKSLTSNVHDFSALDEARTLLIRDKLVFYYAGFKAYTLRISLTKTHPSRLARLQQQLQLRQQQQQQAETPRNKSGITVNFLPGSTPIKTAAFTPRKSVTVMSKHHPPPSSPLNITTITKTQHVLDERMNEFAKIIPNKATDVPFPTVPTTNKRVRQRSATNKQTETTDRQSSANSKILRGPILVQYTLTSGLKVKYSDGRQPIEGIAIGGGGGVSLQQTSNAID